MRNNQELLIELLIKTYYLIRFCNMHTKKMLLILSINTPPKIITGFLIFSIAANGTKYRKVNLCFFIYILSIATSFEFLLQCSKIKNNNDRVFLFFEGEQLMLFKTFLKRYARLINLAILVMSILFAYKATYISKTPILVLSGIIGYYYTRSSLPEHIQQKFNLNIDEYEFQFYLSIMAIIAAKFYVISVVSQRIIFALFGTIWILFIITEDELPVDFHCFSQNCVYFMTLKYKTAIFFSIFVGSLVLQTCNFKPFVAKITNCK